MQAPVAGRRNLPLTDDALAAFEQHRATQRANGFPATDGDPIIVTEASARVHPDMLEKWWARAGVHPKVMQELVGHANCSITMDIYTHVNMDGKREAAEALEQVMRGDEAGAAKGEDE